MWIYHLTHIEETEELDACKETSNSLCPEMHEKPVYTYKLKEGVSDDRHGMVLIEKKAFGHAEINIQPLDN
ncbi:hypothetical protein CS542_07995 [Pedobacter sp. IW39]|nr:hypothetical protein CS542_07995 [Pedobacter sp. IW39]